MIVSPVVATAIVFLGAVLLGQYSWVLFILLPVGIGVVSTVIYNADSDKSYLQALLVALCSIFFVGIVIMALAIEGLICLVMALPLAIPGIAIGVLIGWLLTRQNINAPRNIGLSMLLFAAMPLLMGFEASTTSTPTVHKVISTVEVDAPIDVVWKNVIEFPEIDSKPEGILTLGFAYPINAKIHGTGVGAIRHCNFNTGPFVEPITAWDAPNLLAFDVAEQPAPMTELSFYDNVHAAHLDYIKSQKGQFRLYERDGKTLVEGTTFYTHDIAPDVYWQLFSDEIIHQIHLRVLTHIKQVSEDEANRN
jgi:hypothetical protein